MRINRASHQARFVAFLFSFSDCYQATFVNAQVFICVQKPAIIRSGLLVDYSAGGTARARIAYRLENKLIIFFFSSIFNQLNL
jgi:hypothetical protein